MLNVCVCVCAVAAETVMVSEADRAAPVTSDLLRLPDDPPLLVTCFDFSSESENVTTS